jgi:hypothetical protein
MNDPSNSSGLYCQYYFLGVQIGISTQPINYNVIFKEEFRVFQLEILKSVNPQPASYFCNNSQKLPKSIVAP